MGNDGVRTRLVRESAPLVQCRRRSRTHQWLIGADIAGVGCGDGCACTLGQRQLNKRTIAAGQEVENEVLLELHQGLEDRDVGVDGGGVEADQQARQTLEHRVDERKEPWRRAFGLRIESRGTIVSSPAPERIACR